MKGHIVYEDGKLIILDFKMSQNKSVDFISIRNFEFLQSHFADDIIEEGKVLWIT